MDKKRRYPGVYSFSSEQADIFYGRDEDIKKMVTLIKVEPHLLLYSKSGVGKTSLINAGVIPSLSEEYEVINVRFYAYNDINEILHHDNLSPIEDTINAVKKIIKQNENQDTLIDKIVENEEDKNLWFYLKKLNLINKSKKYILSFDQFEELFTYPEEQQEQFKNELSEILKQKLPDKFADLIADYEDKEDAEEFTDEQELELYQSLEIKTIFSIRSDKLSLLNKLSDKIEDIQKKHYELKPLDYNQIKEVIVAPAERKDETFSTPSFSYESEALYKIIQGLSNNGSDEIETTQLQIVCQHIEEKMAENKRGLKDLSILKVTVADVPSLKDLFLKFYETSINKVVTYSDEEIEQFKKTFTESYNIENNLEQFIKKQIERDRQRIYKFIENKLIKEGRRISLDETICRDHIEKSKLQKLTNTHLLRATENSLGGINYELSHDTLIEPVLISKTKHKKKEELRIKKRQLEQIRKREIQEREKKEKELKEKHLQQERRSRAQRNRMIILSLAAVFFVAFAIYTLLIKNELERVKRQMEVTIFNYAVKEQNKDWVNVYEFSPEKRKKILSEISKLNFKDSYLYEIPEEVLECENLKQLNLRNNKFKKIPQEIVMLTKLEDLNLYYNYITKLNPDIKNLKNLKILNIENNKFKKLPSEISELENLEKLNLSYNNFDEFPISICNLPNLKELDLRNNKLTKLSKEIGNLDNLEFLILEHNQIIELPIELSNLTNLLELNLYDNKNLNISSLCKAFENYPKKIILMTQQDEYSNQENYDSSQIRIKIPKQQKIPKEINNIKKLHRLNLKHSGFTQFPVEVVYSQSLSILDLGENQIEILPSEIKNLKHLSTLDMTQNKLNILPIEIGELDSLTYLDFSYNQITKIPESIGNLKNLNLLNLSFNKLTILPVEITNLENLTSLDLSNNQLTSIPEGIEKLTNLKKLDLRKNKLSITSSEKLKIIKSMPNCKIYWD